MTKKYLSISSKSPETFAKKAFSSFMGSRGPTPVSPPPAPTPPREKA